MMMMMMMTVPGFELFERRSYVTNTLIYDTVVGVQ